MAQPIPTATIRRLAVDSQVDSQPTSNVVAPAAGASGPGRPVAEDKGLPVHDISQDVETVAASATAQILGATGAVGDRLDYLLVVPATTSPGAISITDGDGTPITVFAGGATSLSNLIPFAIPWGKACVNATTPGWKVTTGANVSVVGFGDFT